MTPLTRGQQQLDAVQLMVQALSAAVKDASMELTDVDMLIALPSLMSKHHFMIGHAVAQAAQLTPRKGMLVRTLDVGGAGPVAALLAAKHAIEHEGRQAVAIVAGDTVASVPVAEFLARADGSCRPPISDDIINQQHSNATPRPPSPQQQLVPSPVIPNLYDRVARWHMQQYGTTREQLAMCASLMTYQASHHPAALHRRPRLLQEVLTSAAVAPVTTKLECAKLANGAAALLVMSASAEAAATSAGGSARAVAVLGGAEASGPIFPPQQMSEECFSAGAAAAAAYTAAGLAPSDIDYWGLYDCFPICLIRSAAKLALHDYQGALADAQAALAVDNKWTKGWYRSAKALQGLGKTQRALQAAGQALQLEPGNRDVGGSSRAGAAGANEKEGKRAHEVPVIGLYQREGRHQEPPVVVLINSVMLHKLQLVVGSHYLPSPDGINSNLLLLLHGLGDRPAAFTESGGGRSWFTAFDDTWELIQPQAGERRRLESLEATLQLLQHQLLPALASVGGWQPGQVQLLGYSQGGTVALELARACRGPNRLGGTMKLLQQAGCRVELKCLPGKGHSMITSAAEMQACMTFWAARLRQRPTDAAFVEMPGRYPDAAAAAGAAAAAAATAVER
eukprot:gene12329-12464_t